MLASHIGRYATPLLFTLAAISAGLVGGTVTVQGMDGSRYGSQAIAASYEQSPIATDGDGYQQARHAQDCDGCSERDLGYRWAGSQRVSSVNDCPSDNWGFNRGCVAYLRDMTGA
jgi:hypothetical protein